ncbi:hypothetical protein ACWGNF_15280 [Streptomyces sp. NPDC055808]
MRATIGYAVESIGYVIGAQGLVSLVSQPLFGTEWGWLHKLVDLPPTAYLGVVAVGLALVAVGVRTRRGFRRGEAA